MMISGTYERPNPTTVVEVLQGTKEVLRQQGRTRCINFHSDGRVCLQGAILVAVGRNAPNGTDLERDPARDALFVKTLNALNVITRTRSGYGAVRYNDLLETTNEDVFALIDEAIAAEAAAEAGGAA
jgi:hypothetical protein